MFVGLSKRKNIVDVLIWFPLDISRDIYNTYEVGNYTWRLY